MADTTDLSLSSAFLEWQIAETIRVFGKGGIPMKGTVEISPNPEPLGAAPQEKDQE